MNGFTSVKWLMVCLCLAVSVMVSAPLLAQTPDGETPAEETICDPLKADGVTKGLYGLCVAFCEAQDHVALSDPITEEELKALFDAAPSGRILSNYNKKKLEGDPEMPCIKIEEPCPCWAGTQLASIDGYAPTGESIAVVCYGSPARYRSAYEGKGDGFQQAYIALKHDLQGNLNDAACSYENRQESPSIITVLSMGQGTLTGAEAESCLAAVNQRCIELGY